MKNKLVILIGLILVFMLFITTWASLQESIVIGGAKLFAEPWGIATLADAYCGFLTFFAWVAYKERCWSSRILWFIGIMLLGNIAMAAYVLLQIKKHAGGTIEDILLRSKDSVTT